MNGQKIIFYENRFNWNNIERSLKNNEKSIFIQLDEFKEPKSTLQRFIENELYSIPLIEKILSSKNIFKKFIDFMIHFLRINKYNASQHDFPNKLETKNKVMSNYIDADIYEKSDKMSVNLFDNIKKEELIQRAFNFSNLNLYESNRLEIVEHYNNLLMRFFTLIKIIETESPAQIILLSSVSALNRIIIQSIAHQYKKPLFKYKKNLDNKKSILFRYRLLFERLWYWNLWKILNFYNRKLNRSKKNVHLNIIFAHYKNHFPALIQVLKCFSDSEDLLNVIYTPHKLFNHAKELISKNKINSVAIIPHSDKNYSQFKYYYNQFRRLLEEIRISNTFSNLSVEGIPISKMIEVSFLHLYEKFLNSFRYLTNIKNVFKQNQPDMITLLSGNDAIDVLATKIAKNNNISSLFFPHALFSIRRDHDAFEQDYVVCAGEKDREYFSSLGTEQNKLIILGLPLYDKLYKKFVQFKNYAAIKQKIQTQFNINPYQKIITLVTTHDEVFVRERVFKSVVDITENNKQYFLIVKIHPIENIDFYYKLADKYKVHNLVIIKKVDLHDILIASDLIIGRSSGAQIEAILLNKNVIDVSYEARTGRQLMEKFNAVISVYNPYDLENTIKDCLYNEEIMNLLNVGRKNYSEYSIYKFDGNASMRIKTLIEKILN